MISRVIKSKDGVKVTLKCLVDYSVFTGNTCYSFFAKIDDGKSMRNVYPQRLCQEQKDMSVEEYINGGRCEFFKHIRSHHMLGLIESVCKNNHITNQDGMKGKQWHQKNLEQYAGILPARN